jgi:hypothetical protein
MRIAVIAPALLAFGVSAFPSLALRSDDNGGEQGRLITIPPVSNDTGIKQIPGAYHCHV